MKYIILLYMILCLSGCAMFTTTPKAVVQGAELSAQFATINKKNVRAINDEFRRVFINFIERYVVEDLGPDAILEVNALHKAIGQRFYFSADMNAALARAIADYLTTPGVGSDAILDLLFEINALKG